jgi:hypothetical protein
LRLHHSSIEPIAEDLSGHSHPGLPTEFERAGRVFDPRTATLAGNQDAQHRRPRSSVSCPMISPAPEPSKLRYHTDRAWSRRRRRDSTMSRPWPPMPLIFHSITADEAKKKLGLTINRWIRDPSDRVVDCDPGRALSAGPDAGDGPGSAIDLRGRPDNHPATHQGPAGKSGVLNRARDDRSIVSRRTFG